MQAFDFHLPVEILFGRGRIVELGERMRASWKSVLIVTDRNVAKNTEHLDRIRALLKGRNLSLFDAVEENPSFSTVEKGRAAARELGADLILGLGGGSPMDVAKGIAVVSANAGTMEDYMAGESLENDPLPVVCIPTTSGTGSEVTPFAVFTDPKEESKKGFSHTGIFPVFSIIDPELTFTMPEHVIIDTGLDALTHAVEACLSVASFPFIDMMALESVKLIIDSLHKASLKDRDAMIRMAYASMLAGAAIAHASTILLHIMGYPLTVYRGVSHGRANAALLPAFMLFMKTRSTARDKASRIEALFGLHNGIEAYVRSLGISTRLSDYHVWENDLQRFVQKVIVKGDVKITPARITEEVILGIYRSAL
ncbi:MAG: iron-containing alcohol dehydrogenase [Planctomycetota bacterium]